MNAGSVILARVQQSDGRLKNRPAVVLSAVPPYNDLLICGISSQLRHEVAGFDDRVRATEPDFPESGLKVESLVRLGLLATIPQSAAVGELGTISRDRLSRLRKRLADYLTKPV